ncbi:hypothetical protein [uncultured Alistipes sp.]|uniref:hypothetical protein n=1 Tax=uncultured Alistipes sp. TaxID=538949 RepID=UPI002629A2DF|nr:hypothetical protein [uncultured Alistipes sp.]
MEENKYGYDPSEDEEGYYDEPAPRSNAVRGYRIVIALLSVILVAVSLLYFSIHRQQMRDNRLLSADRDSLQSDLTELIVEYDGLKERNDSISAGLDRANEMIEKLKRERSWNYAKLKQYERELGTLRTAMHGYIKQIDSLNTLNKKLITENVSYRKEISSANLRADMAEERTAELENKVKAGAVILARDLRMEALNRRGKAVTRIKNAERLRVDFVLSANQLATPGNKAVYLRITSPDGYVLTTEAMPTFEFEGELLTYSAMREVDYQNEDLEVGIYYNSSGFTAGAYRIELYMEGRRIGSTEIAMR